MTTICTATWHPTPGTELGPPIHCHLASHHDGLHVAKVDGEPREGLVKW